MVVCTVALIREDYGWCLMERLTPADQVVVPLQHYCDVLAENGVAFELSGSPVNPGDVVVSWVTCDSRAVRPQTLFVCKGAAFKAAYLEDAVRNGAVAYVSEVRYEQVDAPCILVRDIRAAQGVLADAAYDHPSGRIKICTFTGTKGKTTCVYYLKSILDACAAQQGAPSTPIITTAELNDGIEAGEAKLTTPEPLDLQRHIANAVKVGAPYLVMETSSQALKYGRVLNTRFEVGAFTNIGNDHISPIEHPTFEDYFTSKLALFKQCNTAVVNLDADHADEVLQAAQVCQRVLTYSMENESADVRVLACDRVDAGIRASVAIPDAVLDILLPTPALFNMSNALAAIAIAVALGVSAEAIEGGLRTVAVPGRMQMIAGTREDVVGIVDYAHNGMSLETLLTDVKASYPNHELCLVFGAAGMKGIVRREEMGTIAGKLADRIIITEEDPYAEDSMSICEAVASFVAAQGHQNWKIVHDREEALTAALEGVTGPCVLIAAGKGDEKRIARASGPEPYKGDDVILRELLNK